MHLPTFLTSLLFLATSTSTTATPLAKRWECSSSAPGAFSCYPSNIDSCKNVAGWVSCAQTEGIDKCKDPAPSETVPVSQCQGDAFAKCGLRVVILMPPRKLCVIFAANRPVAMFPQSAAIHSRGFTWICSLSNVAAGGPSSIVSVLFHNDFIIPTGQLAHIQTRARIPVLLPFMCETVKGFYEENKSERDYVLNDGICKIWAYSATDFHRHIEWGGGSLYDWIVLMGFGVIEHAFRT
ncbi:uncharacterized protein CC84DRAFT_1207747 [Paraphaeosphaeria sporulosa]|uniref:Extracellular membrane protein CFEM domain-containing protein n=1 Tax=Paraphaeosphaeria sporulosa TaxID=1460663 RepID=A0A177C7X5_9PLEO|nr:uncharacterized protein CC84DRAFT_1207747 [Paraphaeosphaeria sporulosa]OAG02952.1 hypothetical protein CC84DRAFT_1207747 [Paraphaeosphaeria sporulosa]